MRRLFHFLGTAAHDLLTDDISNETRSVSPTGLGWFDDEQGLCPELRPQTNDNNLSRCGAGRSSFGSTQKNISQDDGMVMNFIMSRKDERNPA